MLILSTARSKFLTQTFAYCVSSIKDGVSRQKAIYERIESFGFEKVFEGSSKQEVIFVRRSPLE
jgi:hypothetical protein